MRVWDRLLPPVLYLWSLAWVLSRYFPDLPPGNDSCFYLVEAKGFATGMAYRDLASPGTSVGALIGPSFFPWLLSLYWRFLDPNLAVLKLAIALAICTAPPMAYLWLRRALPRGPAAALAAAFGASWEFIVMGNSIMTESVFLPLLYTGLWLTDRAGLLPGFPAIHPSVQQSPMERSAKRSALAAIGAAMIWVATARTRVIGWGFLGVYLFLLGRKRRWGLAAGAVAAAAVWTGLERFVARGVRVSHYTDTVFDRKYPIQLDVWLGIKALAANLWKSLFDFATAVAGHMAFPFPYEMGPMDRMKRVACVAVALWAAWGAWLAWRRRPEWRLWLAAAALASVPTFLIFQSHDSFRYHLPFLPFLLAFLLAPFEGRGKMAARATALVAGCLLFAQIAGSWRHDFESDFMDYPRHFRAIIDSLGNRTARPQVCFTQDPYYTWLRTGCPSLPNVGRREPGDFRGIAEGKEAWIVCGPGNDFVCERWRGQGMVLAEPPLFGNRYFQAYRIEAWPPGR